ncbi:MAG: hypothetical protein JNJ65_01645 [Cyclobacteriaceae bacterium]|nr:hypothetical protein [Cyclobacteriaceae bacterium]
MGYRLLSVFLIISGQAIGQKIISNSGLFVAYNSLTPSVRATISDRYYISGGTGTDGFEVGLFGSFKRRGCWEGQLSYLFSRYDLVIENRKWQEDLMQFGSADLAGGIGSTNRMIRFSVNRGFLVGRNFSLKSGVLGIMLIDDPHYKDWNEEDYEDWQKDMSYTVFEFGRSINRFMLSVEAAVSYYFGPLEISFVLEGNVSPVMSQVAYHGQKYPVKYDYLMWTVGVNYTVFESKK